MYKILILTLSLIAGPVYAQTYKCVADGYTVYSDTPCGQTAPLAESPKKAKSPQGLRPGEKQLLRSVEAREAAERKDIKQSRAEEKAAQRNATQDARRCRNAKRQIAAIEEELNQGYKAKRGEKLKRKLGEYKEDVGLYCK